MISVCTSDNACFAWSVSAILYLAEKHANRNSSYPHYMTVLNLAGIEFPMTLKDISRFEHLNAVLSNVYGIKNGQVHRLRLISDKRDVNVLYLPDPLNGVGSDANSELLASRDQLYRLADWRNQ